ncbi:MAG: hypothetical protein II741_05210 [Lachnospiraceae bacterium]|nr:hypothetical protein [Lachnospiraceae bacterium]
MPNLLKTSYVNISNKDKRVIDMNALMEAKLEKMRQEEQRKAQERFVAGINAEVVDENGEPIEGAEGDGVEGLFADNGEEAEYDGEGVLAESAGGANIGPSAFIDKANEEAAMIIEKAHIEANEIIESARARAQADADGIYAEANERGYNEGSERARAEYEEKQAQLAEREKQLEAQYAESFESIETELVDTITDIYEYIFNIDLSGERGILLHLIESAMRKIEGTKSFFVHVSAEDAAYVTMQKKALEAAATHPDSIVEVIEDISLSKNQCFIETDGGIFDCGLDTELTELSNKLKVLSYEKKSY